MPLIVKVISLYKVKNIPVSCAIILGEADDVLAAQRGDNMSMPLKWEFPGGKIEDGETPWDCLVREIKEELNMSIIHEATLPEFNYDYESFSITLYPFLCKLKSSEMILHEHRDVKWQRLVDLHLLDWAAADVAIVEYLQRRKDLP